MKQMKKLLLAAAMITFSMLPLSAQEEDMDKQFEEFAKQAEMGMNSFDKQSRKAYEEHKKKADAEFEQFLRDAWEKFNAFDPIPAPTRPEPPTPVTFDKTKPELPPISVKPAGFKTPEASSPTVGPSKGPDIRRPNLPSMGDKPVGGNFNVPGGETPGIGKKVDMPHRRPDLPAIENMPPPGVYVPGQPYMPVMVPMPMVKPKAFVARTEVTFYGTTFEVATTAIKDLVLAGNRESDVADAWKSLCSKDYDQLIADCRNIKQKYQLSDWAYLLFVKQIGTELYGAERAEEIVFLQMFVLNKSGYKVRLAKIDDKLKLLIAPAATIYGTPYLKIEGDKYYVFEPQKGGSMSIYTYRQNFADAQNLVCLNINGAPLFDVEEYNRTFTPSTKAFNVKAMVNKNVVDFYRDYPQCDVVLHYQAPMSEELRTELYTQLKDAIKGKSQEEAANILIDFVQTAFEYQTDGEQFGYEKPFFPEETFFYPYCDCEDRAMLFATLVRDLLGLEAVLLDYPGHIASAVRFTEDIEGDAIILNDGSKYLICDPTYIGATIGSCMPQFKEVSPEIIR